MRYLYRRGHGASRRVMHLCAHNILTGEPDMTPACRIRGDFDTTCNFPLGLRVCRRCLDAWPRVAK